MKAFRKSPHRTSRRRAVLTFASSVAALFGTQSLQAANTVKTVNDATDLSLATTYSPSGLPGTSNDVQFNLNTYTNTTFNVNGAALVFGTLDDTSAQALTITNNGTTAGSITLGQTNANNSLTPQGALAGDILFVKAGSSLTIQSGVNALTLNVTTGGGIDNAGTLILAAPINLSAGKNVNFIGNGATTVSGGIAATSGGIFVNNGTGSVTLSGTNAETGATVISGGTLNLTGSFTGAGSNVAVGAGTFNQTSTGVIATGAGTFGVNNAASVATLAGNNSYTGGTSLSNGTLNLNSTGALGSGTFNITGGTINNTSGATIASQTNNPAITLGGNLAFGGTNNLNLGTGAVSVTGSRTITLGGNGSMLTFGGATTITTTSGVTTTVNGAGNTLALGSLVLGSANTSAFTNTFSGSGNITIAGAVSNGTAFANALTYSGTGTLTFNGANTYTGATILNSGTLVLNSSSASAITVNGGTFNESATGIIGSGTSGFTINGGTVNLSGANTYTGATGLKGGTLALNFAATNPGNRINASSNLNLGGGTGMATLVLNGASGATNSQSFNGGTTFNANNASAIVLNQNGATSLSLALNALARNAGSTVDFTLPTAGAVTTSSTTAVSSGVLVSAASNGIAYATVGGNTWATNTVNGAVGTIGGLSSYQTDYTNVASNIDVGAGAAGATDAPAARFTVNTMRFNAANQTLDLGNTTGFSSVSTGGILVSTAGTNAAITDSSASGNGLQAGGGRELVIINNGSLNVGVPIQDNALTSGLTLSGTGTTTLNGVSTYTGGTAIANGTVNIGSAPSVFTASTTNGAASQTSGPLGAGTAVTMGTSATAALTLTGDAAIGSLAGGSAVGGNIALGSNTLTIGTNNSSSSYAGVFTGTGNLVKLGTGTQTLSGTNVLNGGGTLNILEGQVTVNGGGLGSSVVVNLGDTTAGNSNSATYTSTISDSNTINVRAGSTGTLTVAVGNNKVLGTSIVLGTGTTPQNVTFLASGGGTSNYNGAVSGYGNFSILNTSNSSLVATAIQSGAKFNNVGTIANVSTNTGNTVNFQGTIQGNVTGLIQNSTQPLVVSGTSPLFTGDTTVTSGTLTLTNSLALPNSVLVTNSAAGNVQFGTAATAVTAVSLGGLAGSGNVNLSNASATPAAVNLTLGHSNVANGSATNSNTLNPVYTGILSNTSGSASVTKVGTNTQTFAAANTYSGGTNVTGGTLLVTNTTGSGTGSGAVSVINSGSTLGGTGTITGMLSVGATGTSGAILLGGTPGSTVGALTLSGTTTLSAGSIIELTLGADLSHSSLAFNGTASGVVFAANQQFTFLGSPVAGTYDNILTGVTAAEAADAGSFLATNAGAYTFFYDGAGNIDLAVGAVPEPSTWVASLLCIGALGISQRRRWNAWLAMGRGRSA